MTRDETKQILMTIQVAFPNWKPQGDLAFTVNTWFSLLGDYEYKEISLALKSYILTDSSGFAPSIGQLIDKAKFIDTYNSMSEMEAWESVSRALRDSAYHAEEQFEKLAPIVQKVVGSPSQLRNWGQTDQKTVEGVVQSNFMRSYRTELARERELSKMPSEIKNMIAESQRAGIEARKANS